MCYASEDKSTIIFLANSNRYQGSEEEMKDLLERSKHKVNLELLKQLDEDNLIDYSIYENN